MTSGLDPATITKAQMTNPLPATAKTYIISADTRINIRRAEFNAENRITNDYIVDGYLIPKFYGGLDLAGNSSAYIANNLGSYGLNRLGRILGEIEIQRLGTGRLGKLQVHNRLDRHRIRLRQLDLFRVFGRQQNALLLHLSRRALCTRNRCLRQALTLWTGKPTPIVPKLSPAKISAPEGNNLGDLLGIQGRCHRKDGLLPDLEHLY